MCVVWTLKVYSLWFQVYNMLLLTVVTMLYLRSPELYLVTGNLYSLISISPFPHLQPLAITILSVYMNLTYFLLHYISYQFQEVSINKGCIARSKFFGFAYLWTLIFKIYIIYYCNTRVSAYLHKNVYIKIFIGALFVIAQWQKYHKCSFVRYRFNKTWYSHKIETL